MRTREDAHARAAAPSRAASPLVSSPISRPKFSVFPRALKNSGLPRPGQTPPPVRTQINHFSENSRRRLRFVAMNAWPKLISQICLTYHHNFPTDGVELKRHLDNFLRAVRKRGLFDSYLWILEFQKRGAPHFHFFLSLPADVGLQEQIITCWLRSSGQLNDDNAWRVHMHERNFITWDMGNGAYICKYLDKCKQKDVPDNFTNVGRFWGSSRGLVPAPIGVDFDDFASAFEDVDTTTGEISDPLILAFRWLGRWHERQVPKKYRKHRRLYRRKARFTGWTLPTGAAAFLQIERYLSKMASQSTMSKLRSEVNDYAET